VFDPEFADRQQAMQNVLSSLQPALDYKKCAWCAEAILDSQTSLFANGQLWHQEHFFCSGQCNSLLTHQQYFVQEGQAYCMQCFMAAFGQRCGVCQEYVLEGFCLEGVLFHVQCIRCCECGLANTAETGEEFSFHLVSPPAPSSSSSASSASSPQSKQQQPPQFYCAEHYTSLIAVFCPSCQQPVTGPSLQVGGSTFHPHCVSCRVCSKPFEADSQIFVSDVFDGVLFCASHVQEDQEMCVWCGEPQQLEETISGPGGHYHISCLVCSVCGEEVGAEGLNNRLQGHVLCNTHYAERLRSLPTCSVCSLPLLSDWVKLDSLQLHMSCCACSSPGCKADMLAGGVTRVPGSLTLYCSSHTHLARTHRHTSDGALVPATSSAPTSTTTTSSTTTSTTTTSTTSTTTTSTTATTATTATATTATTDPSLGAAHGTEAGSSGGGGGQPSGATADSAQLCPACNEPVLVGSGCGLQELLELEGATYHKRCVVCFHCKCDLAEGVRLYRKEGRLLCRQDFFRLYAPKCAACHQFLTQGATVTFKDRKFHQACFVCSECGAALTDGKGVATHSVSQALVCGPCDRRSRFPVLPGRKGASNQI